MRACGFRTTIEDHRPKVQINELDLCQNFEKRTYVGHDKFQEINMFVSAGIYESKSSSCHMNAMRDFIYFLMHNCEAREQ